MILDLKFLQSVLCIKTAFGFEVSFIVSHSNVLSGPSFLAGIQDSTLTNHFTFSLTETYI